MFNQKLVYFLAYSYAFVMYGCIITGMGPIIPYYSQASGRSQTQFSYIFFIRALGYLFGGSIIKYLVHYFNTHHLLMVIEFIGGLALIFSSFNVDLLNLGVCMFISAACCCMINVLSNMCILKIFSGMNQDFWVQLLHTVFGGGGLIGPLIIIKFEQHSFFVIGCLFLSTIPIFTCLKSPESRASVRKSEIAPPIARSAQIITCLLYLFYIGQQVGFGSWLPSYIVMQDIAGPDIGSLAGSVFWISNTTFRIILLYFTGKISFRLRILIIGMICSTTFILFSSIIGFKFFAAFFGAFLVGMFLASMFALFLTLPGEYGLKVSASNTANFMMCASMGQGMLTMPIGYAMGIFGPQMLFIIMTIMSIVMYFLFERVIKIYQYQYANPNELQKKIISDDYSQQNIQPY